MSQITALEGALSSLCKNPPISCYERAESAARHYSAKEQRFPWDLLKYLTHAASVLEPDCDAACFYPHVEARGGVYTGLKNCYVLAGKLSTTALAANP